MAVVEQRMGENAKRLVGCKAVRELVSWIDCDLAGEVTGDEELGLE
jgi:hypothetical protein